MSSGVVNLKLHDVPDDHELIHGQLIKREPWSFYNAMVANALGCEFNLNPFSRNVGRGYIKMYFRVPTTDDHSKIRHPDLAFMTEEKWPQDMPLSLTGNAMSIVPDLVVEVIGQTDKAGLIQTRTRDYILAGVTSVWNVYPIIAEVHCYEVGRRGPRVFGLGDTLAGDPVLPGFELAVDKLFPPVIPESIPEPPDDV